MAKMMVKDLMNDLESGNRTEAIIARVVEDSGTKKDVRANWSNTFDLALVEAQRQAMVEFRPGVMLPWKQDPSIFNPLGL